jgi:hypothetical protein
MSFSKQTLEQLSTAINQIVVKSQNDNDLTKILESLNSLIEIGERFNKKDNDLEFYWNEIISDTVSVIYCGVSGQYRLAIVGLRNILEMACCAFFYYDHKIELRLFIAEDSKADKYVSTLINDYHFFETQYIRVFYKDIENIQIQTDSISSFLRQTYGKLCDVVHGRYKALTKQDKLIIEYSKPLFKKFEKSYISTLSVIATLYVLRFNDLTNDEIKNLDKGN